MSVGSYITGSYLDEDGIVSSQIKDQDGRKVLVLNPLQSSVTGPQHCAMPNCDELCAALFDLHNL